MSVEIISAVNSVEIISMANLFFMRPSFLVDGPEGAAIRFIPKASYRPPLYRFDLKEAEAA